MKTISIFLLIITTLATCACAEETPIKAASPAGFETIRLGMPESELRTARPEVRPDDFYRSPNYFERLPADHPSQFRNVTYTLDEPGGRLVQVIFSSSGPLPEIERRCGAFISSTVLRLGEPTERRVHIVDRHYVTHSRVEAPLLQWSTNGVIVSATCFAVSDQSSTANFYQLAISTPAAATKRMGDAKTRASNAAEQERLFGRLLERRPDARR